MRDKFVKHYDREKDSFILSCGHPVHRSKTVFARDTADISAAFNRPTRCEVCEPIIKESMIEREVVEFLGSDPFNTKYSYRLKCGHEYVSDVIISGWPNTTLICSTCERIQEEMKNQTQPEQLHGSPTFYALLEEAKRTHNEKSHDYASNDNPYGNYHFAGQVSSLFAHSHEDAGFAGRIAEKMYRLANLEGSKKIAKNETIEDTERDIFVIVGLWMADRRDRRAKSIAQPGGISKFDPRRLSVAGQYDLLQEIKNMVDTLDRSPYLELRDYLSKNP